MLTDPQTFQLPPRLPSRGPLRKLRLQKERAPAKATMANGRSLWAEGWVSLRMIGSGSGELPLPFPMRARPAESSPVGAAAVWAAAAEWGRGAAGPAPAPTPTPGRPQQGRLSQAQWPSEAGTGTGLGCLCTPTSHLSAHGPRGILSSPADSSRPQGGCKPQIPLLPPLLVVWLLSLSFRSCEMGRILTGRLDGVAKWLTAGL